MHKINPYVAVILAGVIWGLSGPFAKVIDMPATSITFFRCAIPCGLLALYFAFQKIQPFHGNVKLMLVASVLNAARMYLFFVGFLYAPISQAVIMLYTWPIFAAVYAVVFLKERLSFKKAGLLFLAFVGVVVMYAAQDQSSTKEMVLIGLTAVLGQSILYAATVVMFKKEIQNYTHWETIFYQTLVGAVIFAPFILINQPLPELWQVSVASVYGVLLGLGAFGLFFAAMKHLDTTTVSLLAYTEAVVMVSIGVVFFGEVLTPLIAVGAGLIILSAMVMTRYKDRL